MRRNLLRSGGKKRPAATYWRRRFTALVIGLAVFGVIAWAISGVLGTPASRATAASAGSNGGHQARGLAPDPATSASTGTGRPGSASPSPSASTASHGSKHPAKAAAPSAGVPSGRADGKPAACLRKEIVLSLVSNQSSAGPRAPRQFDVDVVSTSTAICRFNLGPKHLALVIRKGTRKIWGSADCVRGQGSLVTKLSRGVPVVLPISWNRQTSTPGCTKAASRAPAGKYSATAIDGTLTSNTLAVRVR